MKKKLVILIMTGIITLMTGCSSDTSKVVDNSKERHDNQTEFDEKESSDYSDDSSVADSEKNSNETDKKYQIGDMVDMVNGKGGKMKIALTDWGSEYDSISDSNILYVQYEIENTGNESIEIGNAMFDIYADGYSVASTSSTSDNDMSIVLRDLSAGRKVIGRLYGDIDPDTVSIIEIELYDTVFNIKSDSGSSVENKTQTEGNYDPNMELAGHYLGIGGSVQGKNDEIKVNMYSSPDSAEVGNISLVLYGDQYSGGSVTYETEITQISSDTYCGRTASGDELTLKITYSEKREEYEIYVSVNGQKGEIFELYEKYES